MEGIERTYLSFARRRRTMALSSSCTCDACRRTPELDLKFCAHHGTYVEHEVAGSREVVGPDVILAHRLLKNTVADTYGLRGYALITAPCVEALGISGLTEHTERYDDVGPVAAGLVDLQERWRHAEQSVRTVVARDDADLLFEDDVQAAPDEVWAAMTDPAHAMRWRVGVTNISEEHAKGGRGVGTVTHCLHGRTMIEQEIVDWLPSHHYTYRERNPAGPCLWTIALAPLDGGRSTHIEWRFAYAGGRRQALMVKLIGGRVRRVLGANFDALLAHVREQAPTVSDTAPRG
jgi:uncharacterized protein YndB with AHSA1/START domain